MKELVRSYRSYAVWNYEQEIEDLNQASKNGLQLVQGGCFHSLFRHDDSVRYIYQLDFQPRLADKSRYLETFQDQNWEFINSTFNGWYYFRKPWRENMSQEEQVIYSDRSSLIEMQSRYTRLLVLFSCFYLMMIPIYLWNGIRTGEPSFFLDTAIFLLMLIVFAVGLRYAKRRQQGKSGGFQISPVIVLPFAVIILLLSIFL